MRPFRNSTSQVRAAAACRHSLQASPPVPRIFQHEKDPGFRVELPRKQHRRGRLCRQPAPAIRPRADPHLCKTVSRLMLRSLWTSAVHAITAGNSSVREPVIRAERSSFLSGPICINPGTFAHPVFSSLGMNLPPRLPNQCE